MKILVVASYPGSILKFRGDLIDAFAGLGHTVHVAAPGIEACAGVRDPLEGRGVLVHDIPLNRTGLNPVADLSLLFALYRLMRELRPDVVFPYTIKPVVYGLLAAWAARVRHRFALVTGLGYAFTGERAGFLRKVAGLLYRGGLSRAQKVFFQNPDDRALFLDLGLLPARVASVVVNGSGVDLVAYPQAPVPAGPATFLMIGRLLGNKGVREYAMAAGRLRQRCPSARCLLAGWIDDNPDAIAGSELEHWIRTGAIEFLGQLEDVRPAIAEASVYVLPSYREGTPRTVLEAMAMGRPIITTDAPGCRETVVEGENGFLVPVGSADGLLAAMERFVDQPSLAVEMGAQSRAIVERKYDVQKVNGIMLSEMGLAGGPAEAVK